MKAGQKIHILFYRLFHRWMKPEVRVYEATLSGDGSFIDIRYWLSRPDKINPKGSIYLTHEETGQRLYVMRLARFGAIHTKHNKHQNSGNLLLYNRNGLVKPGSRVALHLCDLVAGGIVVK